MITGQGRGSTRIDPVTIVANKHAAVNQRFGGIFRGGVADAGLGVVILSSRKLTSTVWLRSAVAERFSKERCRCRSGVENMWG